MPAGCLKRPADSSPAPADGKKRPGSSSPVPADDFVAPARSPPGVPGYPPVPANEVVRPASSPPGVPRTSPAPASSPTGISGVSYAVMPAAKLAEPPDDLDPFHSSLRKTPQPCHGTSELVASPSKLRESALRLVRAMPSQRRAVASPAEPPQASGRPPQARTRTIKLLPFRLKLDPGRHKLETCRIELARARASSSPFLSTLNAPPQACGGSFQGSSTAWGSMSREFCPAAFSVRHNQVAQDFLWTRHRRSARGSGG